MTKCLRVYNGKMAIWEKPASGDKFAPFDSPTDHMDAVYFHSDLQYLSAPIIDQVTVNHAQVSGVTGSGVAGAPGPGSPAGSQAIANGQIVTASHTLLTHDLGYVPPYIVLWNGVAVSGGTSVQDETNRGRLVSSYATTSIIGLREVGFSSSANLAAVNRTYDVIVFRELDPDPAKPLFHVKLSNGTLVIGHGKIEAGQPTLRRALPAESTFYIPISRTADVRNGAIRTVSTLGVKDFGGIYTGGLIEIDAIPVTYS